MTLRILLHRDEDGVDIAKCPALPPRPRQPGRDPG